MSEPSKPPRVGARYFDGQSAATRQVILSISKMELAIHDEGGLLLATWPCADVRLISPPGADRCLLGLGRSGEARLSIAAKNLEYFLPHLRNLRKPEKSAREVLVPVLKYGALAGLSLWLLFVVIIPQSAVLIAENLPEEYENKLGAAARDQVISLLILMDPKSKKKPGKKICLGKGSLELDLFGHQLKTSAGRPDAALRITVVDVGLVNAFALPGNQIIVTRGLIDQATNGNEVAAVVAHEIGHLVYKHPTKVALQQAGTAAIAGLMVGDVFGGGAITALGNTMLSSAYNREAEAEADAFAIREMNKAGWDARPIAGFFHRLADMYGDMEKRFSLLASHPLSEERARTFLEESKGTGLAFTADQWRNIKALCRASPRSG